VEVARTGRADYFGQEVHQYSLAIACCCPLKRMEPVGSRFDIDLPSSQDFAARVVPAVACIGCSFEASSTGWAAGSRVLEHNSCSCLLVLFA